MSLPGTQGRQRSFTGASVVLGLLMPAMVISDEHVQAARHPRFMFAAKFPIIGRKDRADAAAICNPFYKYGFSSEGQKHFSSYL